MLPVWSKTVSPLPWALAVAALWFPVFFTQQPRAVFSNANLIMPLPVSTPPWVRVALRVKIKIFYPQPTSFAFPSLQPLHSPYFSPPWHFLNEANALCFLLLQGLCTYCFLFLECLLSPKHRCRLLLLFFQISAQFAASLGRTPLTCPTSPVPVLSFPVTSMKATPRSSSFILEALSIYGR